ncbi:MAG: PaaI family thioesterase [Planctomycetes bacterium]|nr:PaaI family thioesterase [Planctomycetota bacterium]
MSEFTPLIPKEDNQCFACGMANDQGLKMTFEYDAAAKKSRGFYKVPAYLAGGSGRLHGGIISLLLDEISGKVMTGMKVKAVTRNLNIDFLKPIPVEKDLVLEAELIETSGRKYFIDATIRLKSKPTALAKSKALFINIQV